MSSAWKNGEDLTLGGWEDRLAPIAIALGLLLLVYAIINLRETIEQGLTPPKSEKLSISSDAIAAAVIASHLDTSTSQDALLKAIRDALAAEDMRVVEDVAVSKPKFTPGLLKITPDPNLEGKAALL